MISPLEIDSRNPYKQGITEEEWQWLKANGGSSEGIILFTTPSKYFHSSGKVQVFLSQDRFSSQPSLAFELDKKTPSLEADYDHLYWFGVHGQSILHPVHPTPELKKNWPAFLWPLRGCEAILVGLHFHDLRRIVSHPGSPDVCQVKAASFYSLDRLEVIADPELDGPFRQYGHFFDHPDRLITVKTALGGIRTLEITANWQERLKDYFPFSFTHWDEILEVIAEQT